MNGLRVVLCDEQRVLRDALHRYLVRQDGIASVQTVATGDDLVRLARGQTADVVVLELRPDAAIDAVEVLEALRNLRTSVPVLLVGDSGDPEMIGTAMLAGAVVFVHKQQPPEELYDAILRAADWQTVLPAHLAVAVLHQVREQRSAHDRTLTMLEHLTDREREVLTLLALGHSRAEIARRLHLSQHTVRTHIGRAMDKLEVHNQLAAAARIRQAIDLTGRGSGVGGHERRA